MKTMEYSNFGLSYKIKKIIRYIRLYGPYRTYYKILGQYHMAKSMSKIPKEEQKNDKKKIIGIIGCGNYAYSNIAFFLKKNYGHVIRGVMDADLNRAYSLQKTYKACYGTDDANTILNDVQIKVLYIASNHFSHALYAIDAIKRGKIVHIEKPHAVSQEQLIDLCKVILLYKGKCRLGFNRPHSPLFRIAQKTLSEENGASMINFFVVGHKIDSEHWYFSPEEGGRVLGNLTHWTDLVYHLANSPQMYPIRINPTTAKTSDYNISVSYVFGDYTVATITFSAKGDIFEGVREYANIHKGNVLIEIKDFQSIRVDRFDKIYKKKLLFRNHGHEASILKTYQVYSRKVDAESVEYIWNTGFLALETKRALETGKEVIVKEFQHYKLKYLTSN